MLLDVLWREHRGDVLPLKVHHDEAVEATKLRHVIDQELAIALDLGARVPLQGQAVQQVETGEVLKLAPADDQIFMQLQELKLRKFLELVFLG